MKAKLLRRQKSTSEIENRIEQEEESEYCHPRSDDTRYAAFEKNLPSLTATKTFGRAELSFFDFFLKTPIDFFFDKNFSDCG